MSNSMMKEAYASVTKIDELLLKENDKSTIYE